MIYYNQLDYPDIIYSAMPPHTETVATSGCGICAMAMVMGNVAGVRTEIAALANEAVKRGWRIDGAGTDLIAMAPAIAKSCGLIYSRTGSINQALDCVQKGGMVIANVTSQGSNGLFSTGGHFVCIAGIAEDGRVMVLDPYLYSGKFNTPPRKGKVEVKGHVCYVSKENLDKDVRKDYTAYYLFNREDDINMEELKKLQVQVAELSESISGLTEQIKSLEPVVYDWIDQLPDWAKTTIDKLYRKGLIKGDENGNLGLTESEIRMYVVNDRAGLYDK